MTCPRCSVAEISPLTNRCELCGYSPGGGVTVDATVDDFLDTIARRELASEFQIEVLLGLRPASALYLAREPGSAHHVFLRVLHRHERRATDLDERFRRAAELACTLDHPHIIPVLRSGATDSLYWYAMEHVRSRSLRVILATRGPLDLRATQRIASQAGSALDYGHRRGIVHGDLRPETVLIDADGWVRVSDALVSRVCELPFTAAAGATRPAHVAPEDFAEGIRSPAADQYALAALVQECLTGAPPQEHEPPLAARSEIPAHVAHALIRALRPHPADRFPSVLDFLAALESPGRLSLADARPSGRSSSAILTIPGWKPTAIVRSWRWVPGALVIVAILAAGAVVVPRIARVRHPPIYDAGPARSVAPSARPATDTAATSHGPPAAVSTPEREPPRATSRQSRTTAPTASAERPAAARPAARPRPERVAAPSEPLPPPASGGEPGRLFVNATPWGLLSIDGQPVGNTPRANLSVAPGTHLIRVERDGFEPIERTIQVAPGQVVRITDLVLTERRP